MMAGASHILSPDTQAILLLCGSLRVKDEDATPPLSLSEYNQLALWLRGQALRPGDLLDAVGTERLKLASGEVEQVERILNLLSRGGPLALQVESWTNQGLWVISRSDEAFPQRLKDRLKHRAPPILYGAGNLALLSCGGLAIVGSRNADATALEWTKRVAERCVHDQVQVISGGAKGVDQAAMLAALEAQGNVVGILADSLAKASVSSQYRSALREQRMVLVSPCAPHVGFSVGSAMGRNKIVYALSDWTLVVSTETGSGGTWAGATEALKNRWVPVFVRADEKAPPGNQHLLDAGALRLEPYAIDSTLVSLNDILNQLQAGKSAKLPAATTARLPSEEPISQDVVAVEAAPPNSLPQLTSPDTFWSEVIWPLLTRLVKQHGSLDKKRLSDSLGVNPTQADDWLKRAVSEGKLNKKMGPVRYEYPVEAEQMRLDGV